MLRLSAESVYKDVRRDAGRDACVLKSPELGGRIAIAAQMGPVLRRVADEVADGQLYENSLLWCRIADYDQLSPVCNWYRHREPHASFRMRIPGSANNQ